MIRRCIRSTPPPARRPKPSRRLHSRVSTIGDGALFARYSQASPDGVSSNWRLALMDALVASLAMYDFPSIAEANAELWAAIGGYLRAAGIAAPEKLERSGLNDVWRSPRLIFGQTCGY